MKESVVGFLACPKTGEPLNLREITLREGDEIVDGILESTPSGLRYAVIDGIPDFLLPPEKTVHMAESFGFEWDLHHQGGFETETVFGRTLEEDCRYFYDGLSIEPEALDGKLVLDAGCGSGVLTTELARRHPRATFVGLDINPAIAHVFAKGRSLPNLHLVRGNVLQPPLRESAFDLVWSNGVIHHTGDTRRAFDRLTKRVRPGGRAYIWVYQRKLSPMVALRKLLIPFGIRNWNHRFLYRFCQIISAPTWLGVKVMNLIGLLPPARRFTHLRILTKTRGFRELVLTWFDVLSPLYRDTYLTTEVEAWFREDGFGDLKRYWYPVGVMGVKSADASTDSLS